MSPMTQPDGAASRPDEPRWQAAGDPAESWMPVMGSDPGGHARGPGVDGESSELGRLPYNWFGASKPLREGRQAFRFSSVGHWAAGIAMGLLLLLVSTSLIEQAVRYVQNDPVALDASSTGLYVALGLNVVMFAGIPLLWVANLYDGGMAAWKRRLLLRTELWWKDGLWGVLVAFLSMVSAIVLTLAFTQLGGSADNPVLEDLSGSITWGLVLLLPFAAAVSEEVFFRGFLQQRVGIVPTNILFGLVHLSYATPLQVIGPLVLGFWFSWITVRRRSLLPAIVAHFLFNLVALTITKVFPEAPV